MKTLVHISLFLVGLAGSASAQTGQGILRGTVTDSRGALIVGATVIVRDQASGLELSTRTDSAGQFALSVRPGRYRVIVAHAGFAPETREVSLAAEETARMDFALVPAPLSEQVVIVSGSREEELRESSTADVLVLSRGTIRDTGYETVADVLSEQPGIRVRSVLSRSPTVAGEQIQGIDSRQVLVLLDGFPLVGARGIKSGILNLQRQSIGPLDRIEVVKGASSALYGSEAIGGVINLIPREPQYPVQSDLTLSGGSLGILDLRGDVGLRFRKMSAYLDLERHQAHDYDLTPTTFDTTGPKFHRHDLFLRLLYEPAPGVQVKALAKAYRNIERGRSFGEQGPQAARTRESAQNYGLVLELQPASLTRVALRGYFARYDESSEIDVLSLPHSIDAVGNLNERYLRGEAMIEQVIGRRQFVQGGVEWAHDQYRGFNRVLGDQAGQHVSLVDIWFQDRLALHRRLTVALGGRWHHHSLYGAHGVPRGGVLVRVSDAVRLRASFGHGFRAPDLGQLYFRFLNPTNLYQVIGNPKLRPETSRTLQVGSDLRIPRGQVRVTFFRNDVHHLIEAQLIGRPTTPEQLRALMARWGLDPSFNPALGRLLFFYQNVKDIFTSGVETEMELRLVRGVLLSGAYTYLEARDKQTGQDLPFRHRHQGLVKLAWADEKLGLRTNLRGTFYSHWFISSAEVARGYQLWDWYIAKRLLRGTEFFLAIDNMWDSRDPKLNRVPPVFDRADPGRTIRVGWRWNFPQER